MKRKLSIAFTLAVVFALMIATVALADNLVADGDNATPVGSSTLNLGTVCINSTTTGNVLLGITRQGNYSTAQVFKVETIATVAVLSSSSGLTAVMGDPATISIPTNWAAATNGTLAGTVSSTVKLTAGSTPGGFSGTVTYRASGIQAKDDSILNRDGDLTVTYTVSNTGVCAPAPSDTTSPSITPTISGTMGNNGWDVNDVIVSWVVSDPESAITSSIGCGPTTISADTSGTTLTCSATSAGGTSSQSVKISNVMQPHQQSAVLLTETPTQMAGITQT